MTGGSFLAFRELQQLVPEFNKYLLDNAPVVPGKTLQERADLLGARMVGRWKSVRTFFYLLVRSLSDAVVGRTD